MAYPPPVLAVNRSNATPQLNTHAADHNTVNGAVNDITSFLQAGTLVGYAYTATQQAGIVQVAVDLSGTRIDYVEEVGAVYLVLGSVDFSKNPADSTDTVVVGATHNTGVGVGGGQATCPAPGGLHLTTVGIRTGTTNGPQYIRLVAYTASGYVNANARGLSVIRIKPHT